MIRATAALTSRLELLAEGLEAGEIAGAHPTERVDDVKAEPEALRGGPVIASRGDRVEEASFTIEVAPEKLRMITGRGRKFSAHFRQTTRKKN